MIRVLHIVTVMDRGGLETFIMNVYRSIDRTKIQFDFLVHRNSEGAYDKEILSLGGRIFHVRKFNPLNVKYYNDLFRILKMLRSDHSIVHSHLDATSAVPLFLAKLAGYKNRIAHSHSSSADKNWKYLAKLVLAYPIRFLATDLFACGIRAGKFIFGDKTKFKIICNGIDVNVFSFNDRIRNEVRRELNVENKKVIMHIGRFFSVKNQKFIVENLCGNIKYNQDVIFVLVGDGPDRKKIEEYCKGRNMENKIKFLGTRGDISRLLQGADLFVFPSLYEGLPLTLVEAQTSGAKCFISDSIPDDCILTDLIEKIPLDDINRWIYCINMNDGTDLSKRYKYSAVIRDKGFDVIDTAVYLQKQYILMSNCDKHKVRIVC